MPEMDDEEIRRTLLPADAPCPRRVALTRHVVTLRYNSQSMFCGVSGEAFSDLIGTDILAIGIFTVDQRCFR